MGSARSDSIAEGTLDACKIVIAGGFGAGKTTLVGAISEVQPIYTEETLTTASVASDNLYGVEGKTKTTVAMDFGRLTLSSGLILYLFGTPGQERFWFMWEDLCRGALGAVVLADTRRLEDCFPSVDYFEKGGLPFIVAINAFNGEIEYEPEEVIAALDLDPSVPAVVCDARNRGSVRQVLISLLDYILAQTPV
ncbi:MAG TPA: ATP/GTP-binding protein [Streptosporangiaceae bacterium]|nr:ATP/GTP-binding protein [Streptosporangiaceae bacterium]